MCAVIEETRPPVISFHFGLPDERLLARAKRTGAKSIFACRHCYQLACASAREDVCDRAARRADKLRTRLGWKPSILNGEGGKPKWMRWRTFGRLTARHAALVGRSLRAMMVKLGGFRNLVE